MTMPFPASSGLKTGGSGASVAFGLITAGSLVAALFLPSFSSSFGSSGSFSDSGWNTITVTCAVIIAVLAVASFGAARSSAASGVVGGTCLTAAALCGVLGTLMGWGVSGPEIDASGGVAFLWVTAASGAIGAITAFGGTERDATRPRVPGALAIVGVVAACVVTVGMLIPPPVSDLGYQTSFADWNVVFRGADDDWATAVNVSFVAWKLSPALAGLIGFAQRGRWGALFAVAACVPLATVAFGDDQGEFSQLQNNFHPLYGVALAATIILGLVAALVAAPPMVTPVGSAMHPAQWAPDPFGRHQMRYWNGVTWSEHVADGGMTGHDDPGWRTQTVDAAAPLPAMPAVPPPPVAPPATSPSVASPPPDWAASPTPALAPPPSLPTPPPAVDHGATQPKRSVVALGGERAPSAVPTGRVPTVVLPDGRRARLDGLVVIGRDPSASDHAVLVSIDDSARSVSKTHAQIEHRADGTVWVTDLHSTNGTLLVWPDGRNVSVAGGTSLQVDPGAVVEIGDVRLIIERT